MTGSGEGASGSARARFDPDAMTGRPAAEAIEFYRAGGFWVVVGNEGDPVDLSLSPGRVRLTVRDGRVVSASLG